MARPKVLVIQHVPFEPLGTLDPLLKSVGARIRYVNLSRNPEETLTIDGYDALIVLGGPMNADDVTAYPHLAREVELIRESLQRNTPILGICLGAQLLAKALGGSVSANGGREIGWHHVQVTEEGQRDPVLSAFGRDREVFQWHDDSIVLPADATLLASSERCPAQAFRYNDHAYGLQFHLEASQALIERWLSVPDHQNALASDDYRVDPERVRNRTGKAIGPLTNLSNETFSRWISLFNVRSRRHIFPSR